MFENIFGKESLKEKREKEKIQIRIDHREKNSFVISELRSLNARVNIEHLKIGDYIIGDLVVERKTYPDFLNSIINKRIVKQIENIKQYPKSLLIIEGSKYEARKREMQEKAVRGFILSILLKHKIPIYFTETPRETAELLVHLSEKKQKKNNPIRANKKAYNQKEQAQYILEGFPGIGASTAKKLISEFGVLKNIFNAPKEDLEKVLGKKVESFSKILLGQ